MENNMGSKNACDCGCKCAMCDMSHTRHNKHHMYMVRRFFMLALLVVVFCFGVQLGELRSMSHRMHGFYGSKNMMWDNNTTEGKVMKIQLDGSDNIPEESVE